MPEVNKPGDTSVETPFRDGKTVPVVRDATVPISSKGGNYEDFPASNCQSEVTYENRMSKLSDALGNMDSVKG